MYAARRSPQRQRGSVIVMVTVALILMLALAGLIVDMGRMFIIKSELQNATDACALAAARELTCDPSAVGGTCPASFLQAAQDAGILVGNRNLVNLQSSDAALGPDDIRFSAVLSSGGSDSIYQSIAGGADPDSRYVMCTLPQSGILMTFMRLLGIGPQTVQAQAVATLAPSVTSCAVPLGLCAASPSASADFGFSPGQWYGGRFGAGSGQTGSYDWIDFSPPNGGSSELDASLAGAGECNLPPTGTPVGEAGVDNNLAKSWNTRFGEYKGSFTASANPPDPTGIAYTGPGTAGASIVTWPSGANAYSGAQQTASDGSTTQNLLNSRIAALPYQSTNPMGLNGYSGTASQFLAAAANRRVVVSPVVDCNAWASSQTVPVLGYACVLMLHPIGGPNDVEIEFEGLADTPGNPCATSGLPGGSIGPMVPSLVQ